MEREREMRGLSRGEAEKISREGVVTLVQYQIVKT